MGTAIYLRQSQDKSGQWAAINRQEEACTKLAEAKGLERLTFYRDNDRSASNGQERPEFTRLLSDIKSGRVDALVVWHLDRLTRSVRDLSKVIEAGQGRGLNIASVHGVSLDLGDPTGVAVATILTAIAAMEVEHKGNRQKAANRQRAQNGGAFWATRPFGYDRHGQDVYIVASEAAAIRDAAQKILAGNTLSSVVNDWNEAGLRTTAKNKTTGEFGLWGVTQVRRVLLNPRYCGRRLYNGEDLGEGDWPPILTEELHGRLEEFLTDPRRRTAPDDLGAKYLLSGIAMCGKCGKPMFASPAKKNGKTRMIYRCFGGYCIARQLEPVDETVEARVVGILSRPDAARLFTPDIDTMALRAQASALRDRRDTLAALLAEGLLSPAAVRQQAGKITAELASVESKLNTADTLDPMAGIINAEDVVDAWTALGLPTKRKIIRTLMDVTIMPVGKGVRFKPEQVITTPRTGQNDPS